MRLHLRDSRLEFLPFGLNRFYELMSADGHPHSGPSRRSSELPSTQAQIFTCSDDCCPRSGLSRKFLVQQRQAYGAKDLARNREMYQASMYL